MHISKWSKFQNVQKDQETITNVLFEYFYCGGAYSSVFKYTIIGEFVSTKIGWSQSKKGEMYWKRKIDKYKIYA